VFYLKRVQGLKPIAALTVLSTTSARDSMTFDYCINYTTPTRISDISVASLQQRRSSESVAYDSLDRTRVPTTW